MPSLHIDDAIDFLVRYLAGDTSLGITAHCAPQYDVEIRYVAAAFWQGRGIGVVSVTREEAEPYMRPFFDAAWYLCRIGVLRPGESSPGISMRGGGWTGDGYSVTAYGREWLLSTRDRPPTDPSRFAEVMQPYASRFGAGFLQRSTEALRCYMTNNYLACCTMAGAAAESILLAVATAKLGDEQRVLAEYRTSAGRSRLTNRVVGNVTRGLKEQFLLAGSILNYWRDESAHGVRSSIGEVQAHSSLAQLIRFAQVAADHWTELTA